MRFRGIVIFAFLFFTCHSTLANAPFVENREGRVFLRMDSCEAIEKELPSLEKWGQWKGKAHCATPARTQQGCESDITDCVPAHVVKYQGVEPSIAGPNCWNLALVLRGVLPHLHYSDENDMSFYMSSPLCRKVKATENPSPGDIGAIRHGPQEIHGFIYVSPGLAYSKNGSERESPYALQSLNGVLDAYSVGQASSDFEEEECFGNSECEKPVDVTYFRCKSMDEYLAEKTSGKPHLRPVLQANQSIQFLECGISSLYIDRTTIQKDLFRDMAQVGEALNVFLKKEIKIESLKPKQDPAARFLLGSLLLRVDRLLRNLDELQNHGYSTGTWTRDLEGTLGRLVEKSKRELPARALPKGL